MNRAPGGGGSVPARAAEVAPGTANELLAGLAGEEYARLSPHLKPVTLKAGQTLYRPRESLREVYFPLDAIVGKFNLAADGSTVGIGLIGCEGVAGFSSFLSGYETAAEAVVIRGGGALRLSVAALEDEFERGQGFQKILLRFTQAFIAQAGQIALCNRRHSVEQQLCGWLLFYLDRCRSDELPVTHELIAQFLGVRREGISRAAFRLKRERLFDYHHGQLSILDRGRMESIACECYRIVREAYKTLLGAPPLH